MGSSGGGAFLPGDPPPSTTQTLTNPIIVGATITATGSTLTAPVIAGAATVASGATITTPTITFTAQALTATGTGAADAAAMTGVYPAIITVTGATGSGIRLLSASAVPGAWYQVFNLSAATMAIYSSGATINGTTGTTAFALTETGNKWVSIGCVVAGAWRAQGNT